MTIENYQPPSGVTSEAPLSSQQEVFPRTEMVKFTGQAGEYFGIWFVNNILTWMTLGIYSAWAKVRNFKYFYGNTEVANGSLNFTASPIQILKSRVIAFLLLVAFVVAENSQNTIGWIVYVGFILVYLAVAPLLTVLVMSFQLRYSSWRGVDFRFNKDWRGAYRVYLPPLAVSSLLFASLILPFYSAELEDVLGMERYSWDLEQQEEYLQLQQECAPYSDLSEEEMPEQCLSSLYINSSFFIPSGVLFLLFMLTMPYFDFIHQRFLVRNVRLGASEFSYSATTKDYYIIYWRWMLATFLLISVWALKIGTNHIDGDLMTWGLWIATLIYFPLSKAYLISKRYNLLFGKCEFAEGRFRLNSDVPFLPFAWVLITNTIAVILTIGLMTAWAKIRSAKILLGHMSLEVNAPLEAFIAEQEEKRSALAEEIADAFDIDVAL